MRRLNLERETTARLFFFIHVRGILAAAVRLNLAGPMESQAAQHAIGPRVETVLRNCLDLGLDDVAQTSPLLDLWQGA